MKRTLCIASIALCCLLLTACGAKVTGLKMMLAESLPVGDTALAKITAEYDKLDATEEAKAKAFEALGVTYTSSDEAVATVDTAGTVTAVAGGKVTITATAGGLTVSKDMEVLVPLTGVKATETLELVLNKADSGKVDAKPVPENANVEGKPSFTSSDEKVATVDTDGTVTAVANGEAVITTTLDSKTAETKVTVTTAATGIGLENSAGWIYVGGAYTLKPFTVPAEAPASTYTYTSANTGVATVNNSGVITGKSAGSAKITVKSADGFTTEYTITVNVKPAPPKPKPNTNNKPAAGGTTASGGAATGGGGDTGGGGAPAPAPDPAPPPATGGPEDSTQVGVGGGAGDDAGDLT